MPIISIDTSASSLSVAIGEAERLIASFAIDTGRTHSELLLPMVDQACRLSGLRLQEMAAVAVTLGPGSFTGLRIGLATAKAWAQALQKPLIGVSSAEALALAAGERGQYVCPLFDARRGECYYSLFLDEQRLEPDQALSQAALQARLAALAAPVIVCGDGARAWRESLLSLPQVRFAAPERGIFMAAAALRIAARHYAAGDFADVALLEPCYLRLSEAEERMQQQKGEGR